MRFVVERLKLSAPIYNFRSAIPGTRGHSFALSLIEGCDVPAGSDYFRRQARTCLALAEASTTPGTPEKLRLMAAEFMAKADELDGTRQRTASLIQARPSSSGVASD